MKRKTISTGFPLKMMLFLLVMIFLQAHGYAQVKVFTVAGGAVRDGGPATSAVLTNPRFAAFDKAGNLYVTDYAHRIRRVKKNGVITTVVGNGVSGYGGDGGPAKSALVSFPVGMVFDSRGNMLFSDSGNNRVRKVDTHGIITTIAGNGTPGFSGDSGPATDASLFTPWGLALDASGNLYICDQGNERIRRVDTLGIITTVAGNGETGYSGDGGPATSASMDFPFADIVDSKGNLYIGDFFNLVVRKVDSAGIITTFAGNGDFGGCTGDGGPATSATMGESVGFALRGGMLLISDLGCSRVRAVDLRTNIITSVAGSRTGYDGDGNPPLSTRFQGLGGLLFDASGNLLVLDRHNQRVRKVDPKLQVVSTIVGGYTGNGGSGRGASLSNPFAVHFDGSAGLYIADIGHFQVRKLSANGIITNVAGTGIDGYSGDGGPANSATLHIPYSAVSDHAGNVFIADQAGSVLRKVDPGGTITTFVSDGGWSRLIDLVFDPLGNLYGTDFCTVWKITPSGKTSIVAGVPGSCGFNSDGIPATQAWLFDPWGISMDAKGNLYIADGGNNRVRMVNASTGLISTVAGNGTCGFSGDDGLATEAALCNFQSYVAADNSGNIFIADTGNLRVRWVDNLGIIRTLAGTGIAGYNGEGLPATQTNLDAVMGIAVDGAGGVYVADVVQDRVRRIK